MEQQQAVETGRFLGSALVYVLFGLVIFSILKAIFKFIKRKQENNEIVKLASQIFDNNQPTVKSKKGLFSKTYSKSFPIIIVIFLVLALFYWFQLRPNNIRKFCAEKSIAGRETNQINNFLANIINNNYRLCLTEHGLKPESLFVGN